MVKLNQMRLEVWQYLEEELAKLEDDANSGEIKLSDSEKKKFLRVINEANKVIAKKIGQANK